MVRRVTLYGLRILSMRMTFLSRSQAGSHSQMALLTPTERRHIMPGLIFSRMSSKCRQTKRSSSIATAKGSTTGLSIRLIAPLSRMQVPGSTRLMSLSATEGPDPTT
ncbi:hypothetical protein D3C73_1327050 [compost metagenome]